MFIKEFTVKTKHVRKSKSGIEHEYFRQCTYALFRCDNCGSEFQRARGSMDPKRLSNNYFHVCKECDNKKFAQKRGASKRTVWKLKASSDIPISKL
jgi:DNA-directed RNA polymerase subunit RPC12/RpoP